MLFNGPGSVKSLEHIFKGKKKKKKNEKKKKKNKSAYKITKLPSFV